MSLRLLESALARLEAGRTVALVTVIEVHGSAPRETGARLLLAQDGKVEGTIGGGPLEARALEMAHRLFEGGDPVVQLELGLDDTRAADGGMVCGGRVRLLLERWTPIPPA